MKVIMRRSILDNQNGIKIWNETWISLSDFSNRFYKQSTFSSSSKNSYIQYSASTVLRKSTKALWQKCGDVYATTDTRLRAQHII